MHAARTALRLLAACAGAVALGLHAGGVQAEADLSETIARIKPSVVAIGTFQKTRSPPFLFRGTGFAVGDGTLIATAAHVVAEALQTESRETMMILSSVPGSSEPQAREAKAIAVDKVHDVALLRITGTPLPTLILGNSDAVREGQGVAFTGFPLGTALGFYPVTHRGIIASLVPTTMPSANSAVLDARVIKGLKAGPFVLFQLDASVFPGHSGSPLYDGLSGEVVGVVNMGYLKNLKDTAIGQPSGITFAVPISHLRELINSVR